MRRRPAIQFRGDQHVLFPLSAPIAPDLRPIAANADPETSHEAAAYVRREGIEKDQADVVAEALRYAYLRSPQPRDFTTAELAVASGLDRHMIARRMSLCERRGLVKKVPKRVCRASSVGAKAFGYLPVLIASEVPAP